MPNILIVEDEKNIREFLATGLSFEGHKTIQAGDGKEGVEQARRHLPDFIILDVNMPVMDGWEALKHLRSTPATKNIPVLMLTGEAELRSVEKAMELGATAYLTKPFDMDRLLKKIALIISKNGTPPA